MVDRKQIIEFYLLQSFIKSIESKEQLTAVIVKLLLIKKQYPELPPEDTSEYFEMMYLYDLFNEYVEKTGAESIAIPAEFVEELGLPKSMEFNFAECA